MNQRQENKEGGCVNAEDGFYCGICVNYEEGPIAELRNIKDLLHHASTQHRLLDRHLNQFVVDAIHATYVRSSVRGSNEPVIPASDERHLSEGILTDDDEVVIIGERRVPQKNAAQGELSAEDMANFNKYFPLPAPFTLLHQNTMNANVTGMDGTMGAGNDFWAGQKPFDNMFASFPTNTFTDQPHPSPYASPVRNITSEVGDFGVFAKSPIRANDLLTVPNATGQPGDFGDLAIRPRDISTIVTNLNGDFAGPLGMRAGADNSYMGFDSGFGGYEGDEEEPDLYGAN